METKIARYGNSLTVRLPAALARELDLHDGDRVAIRRVEEGMIIESPRRSRLEARLATVRERETEVGAGHAVGTESFE
jgi:antitoxin component of MazEF toxin-antitoxin module